MERILLAIVISAVWVAVVTLELVLPQISVMILVLAFMSVYSLLLTATTVHRKRKEMKSPPAVDNTFLPKISILVPAHNEESVIARTVDAVMALDYPDFELLVIDDRSKDNTPRVLKALKQKYPDKRYQYLVRQVDSIPGKSAVLNEGVTLVSGDIIAVFDADATMSPDFLRNMVPFLAEEGVGAVQCRKIIANAEENILTRCQNYEYSLDSHFQCGRDSVRGAVELRGNGFLVKREALASVNGWTNDTLTDDLDLSTKLHLAGWDIRFAHKVHVWEEGITRFMPLIRQRRRWAEGSLVRYLEHAGKILTSDKVSLRTTADMLAYFVEFILPLWIVCDYLVLGLSLIGGNAMKSHILSSLLVLPMISIFFITAIVVAIVRFNRPPVLRALGWSIVTSSYMSIIWIPVVFWMIVKTLLQKERQFHWVKTEHVGYSVEPVTSKESL